MEGLAEHATTALITTVITGTYGLLAWALREAISAKRNSRESVEAHRRLTLEALGIITNIQLETAFVNLEAEETITAEQHRRWSRLYNTYKELEGDSRHIERLNEIISLKDIRG